MRSHARRCAAAVLCALPALLVSSACAGAATPRGQLLRATGYGPSQLLARPVCGTARPGQIRCLAQVLAVRRTDRVASVLQPPHARPMRTARGAGLRPAAVASAAAATTAPPQFTAGFLQWAYDTTWLSANNGAGDTVAIVDAYGDSTAYGDMEAFRSANGLPSLPVCGSTVTSGCFELVNQTGQTSPLPTNRNDETGSWNVEESLDLDAVSSLCPRCKILMVEANTDDHSGSADLETAVATAARLGADQISLSWGADTLPGASGRSSPYTSINSAAIFAASGDGSYPGPLVGYPAALADVTAVGGTALTQDASVPRGFAETTWARQTCADGSTCGTESGCDTSQPRPAYQSAATTDCAGRAYNDISADGDPDTGLEIFDSQSGTQGCGSSDWCIVGGTSLATPLAAALAALSGIAGGGPAWTYNDSALLNDIVQGANGSCSADLYLICNAAAGWDGPTGNGSISGAVSSGAPGIGANTATGVNATDVTLSGGVYPNGEPTSYQWQYWVSGNPAAAVATATATAAGSALQAASVTLCGALAPATTYDYNLVAGNSKGTEYGYQGSFTTAASESAPTAAAVPTISGVPEPGQALSAQDAAWNDASCNSSPTYEWQESSSPDGPWTAVGDALSFVPSSSELGDYLRFAATASNAQGSTTVTSAVVGPVSVPPSDTSRSTTTTATTAAAPTTTAGTTSAPAASTSVRGTLTTVRFYRCARTCVPIARPGAGPFRPHRADYGRYIKIVTTVTRTAATGATTSVTTRWLGPVRGAGAGDVRIGPGAHTASVLTVRSTTHRALARVRLARRTGKTLTLVVTRGSSRSATRAWAYVVSRGRVISATAARSLTRPARLRVRLGRGQTLRLVAVSA